VLIKRKVMGMFSNEERGLRTRRAKMKSVRNNHAPKVHDRATGKPAV